MDRFKRSTERGQKPDAFPVLKVGRRATTEEELDAAQALNRYSVSVLKDTAYKLRRSSQYLSQMAEKVEQALREIA
jgi:hypothetical protein